MNMFRRVAAILFVAANFLSVATAQVAVPFDLDNVTTLLKRGQPTDVQKAAKMIEAHPEDCVGLLLQLAAAKHPSPLLQSFPFVLRHASDDDVVKLVNGDFDDPYGMVLRDISRRTSRDKKTSEAGMPIKTAYDLIVQLMQSRRDGDAVTISMVNQLVSFRSMGLQMTEREIDFLFGAIHKDEVVFEKTGTSVQSEIVSALWGNIPRVEARLLEGLSHELPEHRAGVIAVLARSQPMRSEVADRLLHMADDQSDKVRNHLAHGLRWCPHRVDDSVSLLIGFLKQPQLDRRDILESLDSLAAKASPKQQQAIIDAALTLLNADFQEDFSRQSLGVVRSVLGFLSAQQIRQRVDQWILRMDDRDHVEDYLFLLAAIGPKAIAAAPRIRELLAQTSNIQQRCKIAQHLFTIDCNADNVLPIAMEGISADTADTQEQALRLLRLLGPHAKPVLPELIAMVNDPTRRMEMECLLVFREMGTAAEPAVESIAKFLDHKRITLRVYSLQALKAIGPKAGKAVPQLIAQLDRKKSKNQLQAIEVLEAIGPDATPALDRLQQIVESGQANVKAAAEKAIAQIKKRCFAVFEKSEKNGSG